mmetsp:Transcript_75881/g.150066  ORF Transcript_75881/g.150066 Transcript_75881/m.150066 type:complete len:211 (+) Transcript_75881:211-843(+)|eukprot:CAMPEP_0172726612 /NCGR_PEP_ID=MMETSP1074-20121228/91140_1 /TAXON_ID=2916 /ORGANISM="Ceratium fusus, Strain PA161109" /LENGTH=210 /DNA_ID=CAMNT_0013553685 /DNA_START=227 /DNA_END=859 /DNA_ORIENTATION=-
MSSDATVQGRLEEDNRGAYGDVVADHDNSSIGREVEPPLPLVGTVGEAASAAHERQELPPRRHQAQLLDGRFAHETPDPWLQNPEFNDTPSSCSSDTTTDDEDENFQVVEVAQRTSSMNMLLDCLFPMVFAAAILGLLHCVGLIAPAKGSSCACRSQGGRGPGGVVPCEIWQDVRSVLSFLLGAVVCCIVTRERKLTEGNGKVQLYSCLL